MENVFHGIQTNGFAASSASLGVLVELISKYVMSLKHTSTSFVQPSAVQPLLLTAFPFVFLSESLLRCVAETTNEDSNDQCADVVSVIVSVVVGQLDALIAFVRSDLPASALSSVTTTIRTAQVPSSTLSAKPQTTNNITATFGHGSPPRCRGFRSYAAIAE